MIRSPVESERLRRYRLEVAAERSRAERAARLAARADECRTCWGTGRHSPRPDPDADPDDPWAPPLWKRCHCGATQDNKETP